MENDLKRKHRILLVSLLISLAAVGGLVFLISTRSVPHPPPLPPGSPVQILVRALYVNDTGTIRSSIYAEGVNITAYDAGSGSTFSKVTPASLTQVSLIVGQTYSVTAALGMSTRSTEARIGGWGGLLEVSVWDNRTVRSIRYSDLTP